MTKYTTLLAMLTGIAGLSQAAPAGPMQKVAQLPHRPQAPVERYAAMPPAMQKVEGVTFTVDTPDALQDTWKEGFDAMPAGWDIEDTEFVKWSIKAKNFSAIDASDIASLIVEGDYRTYNREISSATSPLLTIPEGASLHAWVGYSLNYDDVCRLVISVSDDSFQTQTDIWNSKDGEGEHPWAWRQAAADLSPWTGKQVQIRLTYTYGSGDEIFKKGGYLGDFAIDALRISTPAEISHLDIDAGTTLRFINLSTAQGTPVWDFPGGSPLSSTEPSPQVTYTADGTYPVSLTIGDLTTTLDSFVTVIGGAPVAKITPPATFRRYDSDRAYMVAPLVDVTFADGSSGYPTSRSWTFLGTTADDATAAETSEEECPTVSYDFLHTHPVGLEVENEHGSSIDLVDVTAEYSGLITNLAADAYPTNFDMEDWGLFPGNVAEKAGITAFAEHFSAPSRPLRVGGCYVFFTKATAEELYDQIGSIGVHLCASENGKPGRKLDSMWWDVIDLDISATAGEIVGTDFPFTDAPFVSDEFFIVVDGFHPYSDTHCVAFAMSPLTDHGGSAWIHHNGDWQPVTDYFAKGRNHTNFYIAPYVDHSVLASLPVGCDTIQVPVAGGAATHPYFTYLPIKEITTADSWITVTSPLPELTVAELAIDCLPLPAGLEQRTGTVTITDGASTLTLTVVQTEGGTDALRAAASEVLAIHTQGGRLSITGTRGPASIVDAAGRIVAALPAGATLDISRWPAGTYIAYTASGAKKFTK